MKIFLSLAAVAALLIGCAHRAPVPTFVPVTEQSEAEYLPYSVAGTNVLTGQAFMAQKGGGVVKAAGRTVTLDPATQTTGQNWWAQAGRKWATRHTPPLSDTGRKLRRTTVADADGRFKFEGLPPGAYYVRTEITWDVPYHGIQGGLVGKQVTVEPGESNSVILNTAP